ncbi:MAG: DUF3307 domain-containing protein [Pseudomonadota bacterium]
MIETFAALLLAHMLADFPLQSTWIAHGKARRDPRALAVHIGTHFGATLLILGTWHWAIAALAAAHLAIDIAKSFAPQGKLWPFLADQLAHVVSLVAIAALVPGLWSSGLWAAEIAPPLIDAVPGIFAVLAGLIAATTAGGYAVGFLLAPFVPAPTDDGDTGLPDAGRMIGLLERGLVFLLLLAGQPAGIGFLIAAKSVLRFNEAAKTRAASEYIIIGTLASFGWAIAVAWATLALLRALPAIGIFTQVP